MDKLRILERIDIFGGLSPKELNPIAELCEPRKYKANEVIFAEKSKGREMYIVTKGQVRIELEIKGKTDCATIHRVCEGDIFGELAIVGEGRRSGTARCETDCEVISINRVNNHTVHFKGYPTNVCNFEGYCAFSHKRKFHPI